MPFRLLISVLILNLFIHWANCQTRTYLGFEASMALDMYELTDEGTELKKTPLGEGHWGINCRQDINTNLFLETGLLRKYYAEGFGFKNISGGSSSNAFDAWLIPIRLGTKIDISKNKLFLIPVIGYLFCINSDFGSSGGGSGSIKTSNDSIAYVYTDNLKSQYYSLLQTGIGCEFSIFKSAIISISTNYFTGFKIVKELDISYTKDHSPTMAGKTYSKGEFWNLSVSLAYPISNFWQK